MERFTLAIALLLFSWGVVVNCRDVSLGPENCPAGPVGVTCLVRLDVPSCDNEADLSGVITSPTYPNELLDPQYFGIYRVVITSCPKSTIVLTLTNGKPNFYLGPEENTFKVGNGDSVDMNKLIPPSLTGADVSFPNNAPTLDYPSSSNSLWMEADLPSGFGVFSVKYTIIPSDSKEFRYYNKTGWIYSTGVSNAPYPTPQTPYEEFHFIDVSELGSYQDLLLRVNMFDISGFNGDYVNLGPGLDYTSGKDSIFLSWRLNRDYKFLIDGPKAFLRFVVNRPIATDQDAKGFAIYYEAIGKNLTTPSPTTTPRPTEPTPLPLNPDVLKTDALFYTYVSDESVQSRMVQILSQYAESSGMLNDGEIFPPLTEESVNITLVETCHHSWNVDTELCGVATLMVKAFYFVPNRTDAESINYAFPASVVRDAVRQYGGRLPSSPVDERVTLPEDMKDVYWVAVEITAGIVGVILILLFIFWQYKSRQESQERKKYLELNSGHSLSGSSPSDSSEGSTAKTSSPRHFMNGEDNPNFIMDEEDLYDPQSRPVITYDPEQGGGLYGTNRYSASNGRPLSAISIPEGSPAVIRHGAGQSTPQSPSTLYPPRGILKSNYTPSASPVNREFASGILAAMDDMDDVEDVLYDISPPMPNHGARSSPPRPVSSSSSSESSPNLTRENSINAKQERADLQQFYGVKLNDADSDDPSNETTL